MKTDWLYMLDAYWDEEDKTYSGGFYFWSDWLFQYYNEIPLGEAIKSAYLMWNSKHHRLTSKYDILFSLVSLVNKYSVTMEEDENQSKNFSFFIPLILPLINLPKNNSTGILICGILFNLINNPYFTY